MASFLTTLLMLCACSTDDPAGDSNTGGMSGGASGTSGGSSGAGGTSGGAGGASGGAGGMTGGSGGTGGVAGMNGGAGGMTGGAGGMSGGSGGSGGMTGGTGGNEPPDQCERAVTQIPECPACEDAATCDDATYTDNGDGTVTSSCCALVWEQIASADQFTAPEAIEHCAALALAGGGWRLPTKEELMTLVDPDNNPPIDTLAFPFTRPGLYWTSTPSAIAPEEDTWDIAFYAEAPGVANPSGNSLTSDARCVR